MGDFVTHMGDWEVWPVSERGGKALTPLKGTTYISTVDPVRLTTLGDLTMVQ